MTLPLRRLAAVTALALSASLAVATPSAQADQDPTVTVDDGVVEYVDPSLTDEDTTRVKGTLRVAYVDRADSADAIYAVETDDGVRQPVELAEQLPPSAANGEVVAEVVDDGSAAPQVASATVEPTTTAAASGSARPHRFWVAILDRSNLGTVPTNGQVSSDLLDTTRTEWMAEADDEIASMSIAENASGAPVIARFRAWELTDTQICSYSTASTFTLWELASAAVGWDRVQYSNGVAWEAPGPAGVIDHLVVVLPSSCTTKGTLGIGIVGDGINATDDTALTYGWSANTPLRTSTVIHELGHNFGLDHASVMESSGKPREYADIYSVMGFGVTGGQSPALDAGFRDELGIEDAGEVETIDLREGNGSEATVGSRGATSGARSIEVVDALGDSWWIELRDGGGRDASSAYLMAGSTAGRTYGAGVTVSRFISRYSDDSPADLVLFPRSATQASFPPGTTFRPPNGSFTAVVESVAGGQATIDVSGKPILQGAQRVGSTLTAAPAAPGTAFQWRRDGVLVDGQTGATYALTPADVGRKISVQVVTPASVDLGESAQTPAIAPGLIYSPTPRILGTVKKGKRLTVSTPWAPADVSYRIQWYANGKPIKNAIGRSYVVSKKYVKKRLMVRVIASKPGYAQVVRWSAQTAKVKK